VGDDAFGQPAAGPADERTHRGHGRHSRWSGAASGRFRTFRDPAGSNKVGLLVEIPDLAAFDAFMKTDAAAEAVRHDGVRIETMVLLAES
jgi:hypothetical protein